MIPHARTVIHSSSTALSQQKYKESTTFSWFCHDYTNRAAARTPIRPDVPADTLLPAPVKRAPEGPLVDGEPGPAKKEPLGVGPTEDSPLLVGPGPKRGADGGGREETAWTVSDEAGTGAGCEVSVDAETGATSEVAGTTGTGST